MKIDVVQVCRRPQWPRWAVILVLVWLGLGGLSLLLSSYFDGLQPFCMLKRLTGVPCPTCGFTRGAISLLHGHLAQAWLYNPLLYSALALFFAAAAVRIISARSLRINLTSKERSAAWILAGVLFFLNWAYVILFVG